jgi:hypothetical protein
VKAEIDDAGATGGLVEALRQVVFIYAGEH